MSLQFFIINFIDTFSFFAFFLYDFSDKQVFSEMDFLGWYSTGDGPSESDIKIHKQVVKLT